MNAPGKPLLQSVLDRLLATGRPPEAQARDHSLKELRENVRRDLERLLNTRRTSLTWPAELAELEDSLLSYGLADFTGTDLATAEAQDAYCRTLERTIRRFEPRFISVQVERVANTDPVDPMLRFRISALLHAEPEPEPLILDSAMDPATRNISFRKRHD
jgi:type VI secretion system protein ImpF